MGVISGQKRPSSDTAAQSPCRGRLIVVMPPRAAVKHAVAIQHLARFARIEPGAQPQKRVGTEEQGFMADFQLVSLRVLGALLARLLLRS
jgi:hypothetical protein